MNESKVITKSKATNESTAWLFVILAGLLEIVWASGFKYEEVPSLVVLIAILLSFDLIIRATKVIPVGTVYAVFAGIGTIGTVIVEVIFENGSVSPLRIALILLLLVCIIGLKLTNKEGEV
ncbi:multidrug transporter EmrE-like cation transporter [Neobacillus niacini]|uniref:DMT family transporter n=1 Tax=Neobacillus niacini TaxID=86668 RepID=UPI00285B62A4|nr:SMR family transporter [Neobacillus niacini]MDR7078518.1 multidrug transporter EmrE-like cation transporter [Neobacillus niacini]